MIYKKWPLAVDPSTIALSVKEKKYRGQAIIELFIEDEIENKFLDIGCGDGFAASYAQKYAKKSVGYDVVKDDIWSSHETSESFVITTDFDIVEKNKPYQKILIYDVLNHSKDPKIILKNAVNLLDKNGLIHVRTHPWTSINATHHVNNLAYIHLYKNLKGIFHNRIDIDDLLFEKCGLIVKKKIEIKNNIEPFFLSNELKIIDYKEKPSEVQYVDYILEKSKIIKL